MIKISDIESRNNLNPLTPAYNIKFTSSGWVKSKTIAQKNTNSDMETKSNTPIADNNNLEPTYGIATPSATSTPNPFENNSKTYTYLPK